MIQNGLAFCTLLSFGCALLLLWGDYRNTTFREEVDK